MGEMGPCSACVNGNPAERESPQVMGPGILPTRDSATTGHAVYEKAAMLGKRRMALQRGAAQEAAAPEGERRPTSCRAPT